MVPYNFSRVGHEFRVLREMIRRRFEKLKRKKKVVKFFAAVVAISVLFGFAAGGLVGGLVYYKVAGHLKNLPFDYFRKVASTSEQAYQPQTTQEQKIIDVVKQTSPAVVSIIITKDVPILEQIFENPFEEFGPVPFEFLVPRIRQKGTEKQEIGGGSGFIVSPDGFVVTNKHVVLDDEAEYTVLTTDGKSYPAKVLAKDPVQDVAVLKIDQEKIIDEGGAFTQIDFPFVKLGNSDTLEIGQSVVAIVNALGEFRNTVSVGVISGLGRTITASGNNFVETIEDVIQTDAAINKGNSGGPLLNLAGEVIGINTATVLEAQSIGFAVPVNKAKRDVEQVKTRGEIVYPFLGVRYVLLSQKIANDNNLNVNYGAWVQRNSQGERAVISDSPAQKAGIKEGDIILEFNGEKITQDNSLSKLIQKYNPEDTVTLKIIRGTEELSLQVTLSERTE